MDEKSIRKYAAIMQEFALTGIELNEEGSVVRLERTPVANAVVSSASSGVADYDIDNKNVFIEKAVGKNSYVVDIASNLVGVFYAAPAENAEPYVKVGDHVKKGDVLCIIEAMKLMNEVIAEEDGVIDEVCVKNGSVVDYGHVLFHLRKEQ